MTDARLTVIVVDIEPDRTVMLLGTLADELLPIKLITLPPDGAAVLNDAPSRSFTLQGAQSLWDSLDSYLAEWQARRKKNVKFDGDDVGLVDYEGH